MGVLESKSPKGQLNEKKEENLIHFCPPEDVSLANCAVVAPFSTDGRYCPPLIIIQRLCDTQQVTLLTSEAEILLIDLDHELSVNISKHATVHPVRHKPELRKKKQTHSAPAGEKGQLWEHFQQ